MLRSNAIKRKVHLTQLYRLDFRPPDIILSEGFQGTSSLWMNNIYGSKTIFCAKSLVGVSRFFLESVMNVSCDGNLKRRGGLVTKKERALYPSEEKCFVYHIDSTGLQMVDVNEDLKGILQGRLQANSRLLNHVVKKQITKDDYDMDEIYINSLDKLESYHDKCARFTEEVIVRGPILPTRITLFQTL